MNFKRAARKSLSGLLSAMMVITQLSNNFTYAQEVPTEDPTPVVEPAPEPEVPAEPTPEVTEEIPPTEEVPAETPVEETPVEEPAEPVEEEVTEEEKEKEKETEEKKDEEEKNYKTSFTAEGYNVSVTATAPKSAKFSETTEMVVEYLAPGTTGEYEAYLSAAKNNLGINDETSFLYGDIYNIYFVDQGQRVTPEAGSVDFTMTFILRQYRESLQTRQ